MTPAEKADMDAVRHAIDPMNANPSKNGHSAVVRMDLHINGDVLRISQMAPDFLILRTPIAHPRAEAEIDVWIDDHHSRWPVYLVEGISPLKDRTKIAKARRNAG